MNKKRLIAIVLAVVLLASLIVGVLPKASAAGAYTISLRDGSGNSSVTAKPGDTVELYLKLSGNPGIISAGAQVSYPSGIALTKSGNAVSSDDFDITWGNSKNVSANPYLVWMNVYAGTQEGKLVTYNGNIRKLTFQVAEDAGSGEYKITLSAPGDKNLTAGVDGSGVIQPNTNAKISPAVSGFTISVQGCNHTFGDWSVATKPTCGVEGKEVRECSKCHNTEERAIAALEHSFSDTKVTKQPTCTEPGVKTGKCTVCGKETTSAVSATGHKYGSWKTTKEATCTEAGEKVRSCKNEGCTQTETKAIDKAAHKFNDWTQTKEPDCTTKGEEKRSCQRDGCTQTETRKIDALGHSFSDPTVTKEPTCTEPGEQAGVCSRCNKEATGEIPATGHSFGEWTVTKEPTCTATGTKTSTCTKCGAEETEKIEKASHQFSSPKIIKKPTCTEPGMQSGKCSVCGKNTKGEIPATGHKYADGEVTKEATCEEVGAKNQICEVCKDTISQEIPALGHKFGEAELTQEATLTTPGIMTSKCANCEATQETKTSCQHYDATTDITLVLEEGVFQPGTSVTITPITTEAKEYKAVRTIVSQISSKFVVFDISAVLDGAQVQPDGTIKISIPIPEDFGSNLALYYISDDEQQESIPAAISEDGKYLEAELSHFSYYALCDLDAPAETPVDMQQIYMIVIGVAGLLLVIVIVCIIIAIAGNKKKGKYEVKKD